MPYQRVLHKVQPYSEFRKELFKQIIHRKTVRTEFFYHLCYLEYIFAVSAGKLRYAFHRLAVRGDKQPSFKRSEPFQRFKVRRDIIQKCYLIFRKRLRAHNGVGNEPHPVRRFHRDLLKIMPVQMDKAQSCGQDLLRQLFAPAGGGHGKL